MSEENKSARRNPEFIAITFSLIESFPKMSKEQAGDAIQTISKYAISVANGKPAEIDDLSNEICSIMALGCAKSTIDRTLNQFFIKSENGKKGGAPKGNQNARKKKRPEPEEVTEDLTDEAEPVPDPDPEPDREPDVEEPNESKLSITNSTESGICIILYDDKAYGDSLKKLKNKEKVADLIGYAAIYLGICDNCDYEFIYDCTEKSYSDFIDEMRKMALGAFGGNNAEFTKAFTNARDYAKLAMKCDRLKLGAAIEEYNERQ